MYKYKPQLFDAVVSPAVLFGLTALPLTSLDNIGTSIAGQTTPKMFGLIVGWVQQPDEDWSETMSRMHRRLPFAMATYGMQASLGRVT
jgi:hypothetical protein